MDDVNEEDFIVISDIHYNDALAGGLNNELFPYLKKKKGLSVSC